MAEYIEPLPVPFTMIDRDGLTNPEFDEQDREDAWREILWDLEDRGVWPHTPQNQALRQSPQVNTPELNRRRLAVFRTLDARARTYAPRERGDIS